MVEESTYEWDGDGKVQIRLKKANGPSYWPELITKDQSAGLEEDQRIGMWKAMTLKYAEEVEDYRASYSPSQTDEL